MQVPLLDLGAQLAPLRDEIAGEISALLDSNCYIMGPKVRLLEENIASYCGTRYAVGVSSGTDALLASLSALEVGPGDLVLTSPYTFFATVGSIVRLGARPVFVDIDPLTYNLDPVRMADVLAGAEGGDGRIKAIIPVHLFGQCADMASIMAMATQYAIPVIEDAAQAIGAAFPLSEKGKVKWRKAGSFGVAGCFSFFPSKNLGGIGDGGMIVSDDLRFVERLRMLREHGGAYEYHHPVVGGNFRLDALQAAVIGVKLPHLPFWHKGRRDNAARYNRLFADSGLTSAGKVRCPAAVYRDQIDNENPEPDYHIFNQYVIRAADRDNLRTFLLERGINTGVYYPVPLHKQKCLAGMEYDRLVFPEAEKAARETLALPVYPELTEEMARYVVDMVAAFYDQ